MYFSTGLFLLVIAVSLDGFSVGITYGMRKVKIPFPALFIIMICSGTVVMTSMSIGHVLRLIISPAVTDFIGGFIFIILGIIVLFSIIRSSGSGTKAGETEETVDGERLNGLRTVLKSPDQADLDRSGSISLWEATLLGTALALDAFGAGLGAAILGFSPVTTTILIAMMSGIFLFSGSQLGFLLARYKAFRRLTLAPPFILIALGIYNLL